MVHLWRIRTLVWAGLLSLAFTQPALADPLVTRILRTGGGPTVSFTIVDNGPNDRNPLPNIVEADEMALLATFPELAIGSSILVSSNQGNLADNFGQLSRDVVLIRGPSGGDFSYIAFATQTDFVNPMGAENMLTSMFTVSFNNAPTSNNAGNTSAADPNNAPEDLTIQTNAGPFFSSSLSPNSFTANRGPIVFTVVSPYSLTLQMTYLISAGAEIRTQAHVRVDAIPEPATLILFGTGLAGIAAAVRRRHKK